MKTMMLGDGARLAAIADDRFQTVRVSAHFMLPMQAENAAVNAMLPRLLTRACAEYPDFTAFNRKLAMLYGAGVYGSVQLTGETQTINLSLGMIDNRFVPGGEDVLTEGVRLLCALIFQPALENGVFRNTDVEEEKRNLAEEIRAEFNDKRTYALRRSREIMFEGEPYGAARQGTAEEVEALTAAEITVGWRRMLKEAQLTVTTVGTVDADAVATVFRNALAQQERAPAQLPEVVLKTPLEQPVEVLERTDAQQAKLVIGLRSTMAEPQDLMALRLGTVLLGGTPSSRLFQNVRERLSLCYYCAARCDWHKGVLFIDCGVQEEKAREARDEIFRQLTELQAGHFTEEELNIARRAMIDQFGTVSDSPALLDSWYTEQLRAGTMLTPAQAEERVRAVTSDQIQAALATIRPEILYVLAGQVQEKGGDAE